MVPSEFTAPGESDNCTPLSLFCAPGQFGTFRPGAGRLTRWVN